MNESGIEKPEVEADAECMQSTEAPTRPDYAKLQVRRPDTALFATLQGLQTVSGLPVTRLRRLALKELADNALDASEAAGRRGAKVEKIDDDSYSIEDFGHGLRGTPEDLAALFALDRPMVSGKFWRLPERGALGNGVRIVVGCVAVSDGTIDVTTNNRRTLLRPYRNGLYGDRRDGRSGLSNRHAPNRHLWPKVARRRRRHNLGEPCHCDIGGG